MTNGDGAKIPVWWLIVAAVGGPAITAGGTAGLLKQDTSKIELQLDRCFRRAAVLEWRVERLENRAPPPTYPGVP